MQGREKYIGGSDAAAVCGESRYRTPLELWRQKTGRAQQEDISAKPAVEWGNRLEAAVAQAWADKNDAVVVEHPDLIVHRTRPWQAAHVDRLVKGRNEGLEIKTAGAYTASQWDRGIPQEYVYQCLHYLSVTGAERWHIAVLIGGNDYRQFCIERDEAAINDLVEKEARFWQHVVDDTEPDYTVTDWCHVESDGEFVEARSLDRIAMTALLTIKDEIKMLEERKERFENALKLAIADKDGMLIGGRRAVTWKSTARGSRIFKVYDERAYFTDR